MGSLGVSPSNKNFELSGQTPGITPGPQNNSRCPCKGNSPDTILDCSFFRKQKKPDFANDLK